MEKYSDLVYELMRRDECAMEKGRDKKRMVKYRDLLREWMRRNQCAMEKDRDGEYKD